MKIKTINLRTDLKQSNLRDYLSKFFRNTKFKSNYIYILTKVSTEGGKLQYNISDKMVLDITDKTNIGTYKALVRFNSLQTFNKFKATKSGHNIEQILIYYIETDKESYDKYRKDLSLSKNFDLP